MFEETDDNGHVPRPITWFYRKPSTITNSDSESKGRRIITVCIQHVLNTFRHFVETADMAEWLFLCIVKAKKNNFTDGFFEKRKRINLFVGSRLSIRFILNFECNSKHRQLFDAPNCNDDPYPYVFLSIFGIRLSVYFCVPFDDGSTRLGSPSVLFVDRLANGRDVVRCTARHVIIIVVCVRDYPAQRVLLASRFTDELAKPHKVRDSGKSRSVYFGRCKILAHINNVRSSRTQKAANPTRGASETGHNTRCDHGCRRGRKRCHSFSPATSALGQSLYRSGTNEPSTVLPNNR